MKIRMASPSKSKPGGWHGSECFKEKFCQVCQQPFKPNSGAQKVCSKACGLTKGRAENSTDVQYSRISGNWELYFARLAANSRRGHRSVLTTRSLLAILKRQKGLCSLSGFPLTCQLEKGKNFHANASVDRKNAFGDYTEKNIHLVCKALNSFRGTTPLPKFIWWCKQVAQFNS